MSEPIRVLQVVTHMNRGGLETMLMNYYRHIDRTKVQFDFLTHREYDGDYGEEIEQLGGMIYHLPALNPFGTTYKSALRKFFEEHPKYTVIHVHQDCLSSVILKEAKEFGIPVRIAHSHNANQDHNLKYLIKLYYKRFIPKYATALYACSHEAGEWMFGNAPFQVLHNAIDATQYIFNSQTRMEQRRAWGIEDGELLVGHVGRFSYQKNHAFLVNIFDELQKKVPAKLILVGDDSGELAAKIKEKLNALGLCDKVIFAGLRSDVADLMQAMDVFVFPSNYEGLGIVAVEAQAAGLPCLISDKVPLECKKTDLVQQVSLSAGAKIWAESAIGASKLERKNTYYEIKNAGYDIEENAKWLQNFYLNAAKR
jgi:glycosyltransferase involved in cell wall biosynthesis